MLRFATYTTLRHTNTTYTTPICRRTLSTISTKIDNIRNIGIIAHIDAGKTTTTERVLYHCGKIAYQGDVDAGSTTTDYLIDERQRGITIQSACTSVMWCDHRVNIIDTPGHVDFMVEVERSLRVLDGAVVVLDGMHGVQAQTTSVWRQADRYKIPRIVFVSKLDRPGADYSVAVRSLRERLGCEPLLLQYPIVGGDEFIIHSAVDLLTMKQITWYGEFGENMDFEDVTPQHKHYNEVMKSRHELIERLADYDDDVAEWFLNDCDGSMSVKHLESVIRNATLQQLVVPVVVGSALANIGIQTLLDGIVKYLPSPCDPVTLERQSAVRFLRNTKSKRNRSPTLSLAEERRGEKCTLSPDPLGPLVVLAFKVIHDLQFGAIVMGRVYSGTLKTRDSMYNARTQSVGHPLRLVDVHADGGDTVTEVPPGNIVAMIGYKGVHTGDTLVDSRSKMCYELPSIHVPSPVFFHSVEATNSKDEKRLGEALENIVAEDPSVEVSVDHETGQSIVKGMGELHLEIVQSRLLHHFKIPVDLGNMMVAYRESIGGEGSYEDAYYTELGGRAQSALLKVRVQAVPPLTNDGDGGEDAVVKSSSSSGTKGHMEIALSCGNVLEIDEDFAAFMEMHNMQLSMEEWESIRDGADNALFRGPLLGYPMQDVRIVLYGYGRAKDTTAATFRTATMKAVQQAVTKAQPCLLEPTMLVEILVEKTHVGAVLSEIPGRRRGQIVSSEAMSPKTTRVIARIPLANCRDLASGIRSQTKGSASLVMEFDSYERVPDSLVHTLGSHH